MEINNAVIIKEVPKFIPPEFEPRAPYGNLTFTWDYEQSRAVLLYTNSPHFPALGISEGSRGSD